MAAASFYLCFSLHSAEWPLSCLQGTQGPSPAGQRRAARVKAFKGTAAAGSSCSWRSRRGSQR